MKFALYKPFPDSLITQNFGGNANTYYGDNGLKGHPAIDYGAAWGTPIPNCCEGSVVYSTLNRENPDLSKYRAVCTIWDDPDSDTSYEVIYGHCSSISAQVSSTPQVNQTLALVGNTGPVYANGIAVSTLEKEQGSHAGAHLHFQVRLCRRVAQTNSANQYLVDGNGMLFRNGCYYEVVNFQNGYNGCVDPKPFFNGFLAQDSQAAISRMQKLISILKSVVELLSRTKK